MSHNIPRHNGLPPGQLTSIYDAVIDQSAVNQKEYVDSYLRQGMKIDYLWIDAGWYEHDNDWWAAKGVGTWQPDPKRFPNGLREVSDYIHGKGMKLLLWFEPERVYVDSFLGTNHPEWLLK